MSIGGLLAGVLLGVGLLLIAVAGIGLLRLPDIYNRMNAVAKAASLGLVCILLGVLLLLPSPRNAAVIGAAILLQLFTAPVGGFALARAAYRAGAPLADSTRYDRLAERLAADRADRADRADGATGPGGSAGRTGTDVSAGTEDRRDGPGGGR